MQLYDNGMDKKQIMLIDQIRQAAGTCGMPQKTLSRAAGIDPAALCRFISGERGLSMEAVNALAAALNLRVVVDNPKRKR